MKAIICSALLSTALAIGAAPATAQSFTKITSEQEFRNMVAGKRLENQTGWALSMPDGTLQGEFGGQRLQAGRWMWSQGFWCRNGILNNKEIGSDCQLVEVSGTTVRLTRNQGRGDKVEWTMK
jgi:hypothetical protein